MIVLGVLGAPQDNLGPELVPNGTFDTASGWIIEGDPLADISGGVLTFPNGNGSPRAVYRGQTVAVQMGGTYRISFSYENVIEGDGQPFQVSGPINNPYQFYDTGTGAFSVDVVADTNTAILQFRHDGTKGGTFDNYSIRKVL